MRINARSCGREDIQFPTALRAHELAERKRVQAQLRSKDDDQKETTQVERLVLHLRPECSGNLPETSYLPW